MSPWSLGVDLAAESTAPGHHAPVGLEWLPFVGLALLILAVASATASRSPRRSGGDGTDDD
jgi:hypothetical protein